MNISACLSSDRMDWRTPENVLELVREIGPIWFDPAGTEDNHVKAAWFRWDSPSTRDSLYTGWRWVAQDGSVPGLTFCNPPYGRGIGAWVKKCAEEALNGIEIIALLPARPDSRWFQRWVFEYAQAILWWAGRIKFVGAASSAPFPSVIVYYGPRRNRFVRVFGGKGTVTCL